MNQTDWAPYIEKLKPLWSDPNPNRGSARYEDGLFEDCNEDFKYYITPDGEVFRPARYDQDILLFSVVSGRGMRMKEPVHGDFVDWCLEQYQHMKELVYEE